MPSPGAAPAVALAQTGDIPCAFTDPLALAALLLIGQLLPPKATGPRRPSPPIVKPVMTKALPDYPGKEGLILTVDYPPGGASPLHHHDAYAFVYVIEGSVVMAVKGGKEVTLTAGAELERSARRRPHGQPQREQGQAGEVRRVHAQGCRQARGDPGLLIADRHRSHPMRIHHS